MIISISCLFVIKPVLYRFHFDLIDFQSIFFSRLFSMFELAFQHIHFAIKPFPHYTFDGVSQLKEYGSEKQTFQIFLQKSICYIRDQTNFTC